MNSTTITARRCACGEPADPANTLAVCTECQTRLDARAVADPFAGLGF